MRAILALVMAKRFDQYCPVAHAMSLVGERWALLVVRELLKGPRRYTDLAGGLPGIGTNVLATRLRELEAAGVVVKRRLPPPAASTVYELTDYGAQLEEVLHAIARWGARSLGLPRSRDELEPDWGLNAFPALLYPERAREVTALYVVRIGHQDVFTVGLDDGCLHVAVGAHGEPDADLAMDFETFYGLASGELPVAQAIDDGRLSVEGDRDAAIRFFEMFSFAPRMAPVADDGRLGPRLAAVAARA
jgi:DNA-binding HxlR family transcriptional regulator